MFWIGTYSTTEKLRLLSNYQDSDYSLGVYADYHQVRTSSLNRWIKQFLTAGLAGLIRPEHNHRYTLQTKRSAVKAYLSGTLSGQAILNRYQIRSLSQLHQWIVRYNSGQLSVAYATRKRARKVGRKVTFEEKRQITQWTIDHEYNYQAAAEKFNVSYQRVYSWVRKYQRTHDWESLQDNRDRHKSKTPTNEVERLRQEVRQLKAKEREVQIAFAKKLVEIHNREVERPDDIKRFRKWAKVGIRYLI